jgi:glutathione S-transferase
MTLEYVSIDDAVERPGLRMVVVGGVPSGWSEAAKGILHIKRIEWAAVRLAYDSELLKQWAGQRSGPVAIYDNEPPLAGWREILLLAERLAPTPPLLPQDALARELVLELSHDICGKGGLGWARRLQLIHAGMNGEGGFPERVAVYLGKKYGYSPETGAASGARVTELLGRMAGRLKQQQEAGAPWYLGHTLTAVDVYSAAFMAMFRPLPHDQCPMDATTRVAFETLDARTAAAVDPVLLAHRDRMYAEHLALPLSL